MFERMFEAQRILRDRQAAIVELLRKREISFALFASNATFVWIESVDESAVRLYRNIDFIIQRGDSGLVSSTLKEIDLTAEIQEDHILFLNNHAQSVRYSDRAFFASERLFKYNATIPSLGAVVVIHDVPVISLSELVKFQLERYKLDDKVDLRDLMDVGLVDQSWTSKLPPELAGRLQTILDTPEG